MKLPLEMCLEIKVPLRESIHSKIHGRKKKEEKTNDYLEIKEVEKLVGVRFRQTSLARNR